MLVIKANLLVSEVLLYNHIEKFISIGMKKGAQIVSEKFVILARENLSNAIIHKNKSTGTLSKAIFNKTADSGLKWHTRWDVIVDMRRGAAPYALWVEYGRNARDGLPYSKKGEKDYTKSKFKGHRYLDNTLKQFRQDSYATQLVALEIVKALLSAKSMKGLKKLV